MRFNAKELWAVAIQPSYKFDKEGILVFKEKKEGLFRRNDVLFQRWCRLRGNLLFYFKTKDQYSEPIGVFVLEHCVVAVENNSEVPFSFSLLFQNDEQKQQLAAPSESERDSWVEVLHRASFEFMRVQLKTLNDKLKQKKFNNSVNEAPIAKRHRSFTTNSSYDPIQFEPCLELSFCCDNLKCDGDGQPPNPLVCIFCCTPPSISWAKFAQTEIVEKSSNPCFLTTATFAKSELSEVTRIKLAVYDVREQVTHISTCLGESVFIFEMLIQDQLHSLRLALISPTCENVGFITVSARELKNTQHRNAWLVLTEEDSLWSKAERPRSYSLPTKLTSQIAVPVLGQLKTMSTNFAVQTYCFHTGLGAELRVHEIMAESKLSILIPCMLLNLWISEEKILMDKILQLGELPAEWRQKQLAAAESHLHLINQYTEKLDFLSMQKSCTFKPSNMKLNINFEFVPVNLHLQRMWVQNVTTRKTGTYDFVTVGAFSAFSRRTHKGGLLRLLNDLKNYNSYVSADNGSAIFGPDPISRAAEAIRRIDQLWDEIEKDLQMLIAYSDKKNGLAAQSVLNSLSSKGNQLVHICIPRLVEDMLVLWEHIRPSNKSLKLSVNDAEDTDVEINASDSFVITKMIADNPEESRNVDHCDYVGVTAPCRFEELSESHEQSSSNKISARINDDLYCVSENATDELEPLDLTHLNIKASIMCMASKIQSFVNSNVNDALQSNEKPLNWTTELMPSIKKLRKAVMRLMKTASLTYGIVSMKESSSLLSINQEVRHRRDIVFSQALTSLIMGLMTRIWCQNPDAIFIHMLRTVGVLVHFEGLLSCYGRELDAIEDMIVGVDDLRRVLFWLEPSNTPNNPQPRIEGNRLFLSVVIPAPQSVIALLPKENSRGCHFTVCSVFFNIGINEKATVAEKFGKTSLQEKVNQDSMNLLMEHFYRFQRAAKSVRNQGFRFAENYVASMLDQLQKQVAAKKNKNVEILHLASEICRHLGGLRFISCKSAKDRTSMSVTLEQAMILIKDFNLDDKELYRVLKCMRSEGTRRENTLKNCGIRKYAFTHVQVLTLPKLYRAPSGTYGCAEK